MFRPDEFDNARILLKELSAIETYRNSTKKRVCEALYKELDSLNLSNQEKIAWIHKKNIGNKNLRLLWEVSAENNNLEFVEYFSQKNRFISLPNEVLIKAAQFGHFSVVEYLLKSFVVEVELLERTLIKASKYGHLNLVKKFLSEKWAEKYLDKVLETAAEKGHLNIIEYLFEQYDEINQHAFEVAYRQAARNGHLEIIQYFDPWRYFIEPEQLYRSMYDAIENGHFPVVKYLFEQTKILIKITDDARWLLGCVAKKKQLEMMQFLIQNMLPTKHYRDSYLGLALAMSAAGGNLKMVQYLLEEARTKSALPVKLYNKSLMSAATDGHLHVIKYLFEQQSSNLAMDYDYRGMEYRNPQRAYSFALNEAVSKGHLALVKYLIEVIQLDIALVKDKKFEEACKKGHHGVVQYLIEHDVKQKYKSTALKIAVDEAQVKIYQFLLGFYNLEPSENNNHALISALSKRQGAFVLFLVTYPAVAKNMNPTQMQGVEKIKENFKHKYQEWMNKHLLFFTTPVGEMPNRLIKDTKLNIFKKNLGLFKRDLNLVDESFNSIVNDEGENNEVDEVTTLQPG